MSKKNKRSKQPKPPPAKVLSTYQLMQRFPDKHTAINYLKPILWPNGPVCPRCESKYVTDKRDKNLYKCNDCLEVFTIRVGTMFHRSHVPLHKWLYAMYLIVTARKGISSMQLSKEIGITQKTAWFLLQRIRAACGNQMEKILSGIIEIDETYIGGIEKNRHESKKLNIGRGPVGKIPIVGLRDRSGQVVAKVIKATDGLTLQEAILQTTVPGSTIYTDEYPSYNGVKSLFKHKTVNHSAKQFVDGMAHTNSIESVWAVIKRGFYGVYHSFSEKHLGLYIDEFVFRRNEGNCTIDTTDRLESLVKEIMYKQLTYKMLTTEKSA